MDSPDIVCLIIEQLLNLGDLSEMIDTVKFLYQTELVSSVWKDCVQFYENHPKMMTCRLRNPTFAGQLGLTILDIFNDPITNHLPIKDRFMAGIYRLPNSGLLTTYTNETTILDRSRIWLAQWRLNIDQLLNIVMTNPEYSTLQEFYIINIDSVYKKIFWLGLIHNAPVHKIYRKYKKIHYRT